MSTWRLARRTFLRGAGASILLPALDVMMPLKASAQTATPPRYISFFMSLGIWGGALNLSKNDATRYTRQHAYLPGGLGTWAPAATGALPAHLPPTLTPLDAIRQKISVLTGLGTLLEDTPGAGINHSCATTAWATSAWKSGADAARINVANGAHTAVNNLPPDSFDQYIANALNFTPGSTLVLSPNGNADYSESQMGGHGGAISYNSRLAAGGSTLVPRISNAKAAFTSLFGSCATRPSSTAGQKSILDYVKSSTVAVQQKLGNNDKARLDSYLQNIRDVETKLTSMQQCPTQPVASPTPNGGPLDYVSNLNMLCDVIALAVSSGAMPIASLMTANEAGAISGASAAAAVEYKSTYVGINGAPVRYHAANLDTHFDIAHVTAQTTQAIEEAIAYSQLGVTFLARLLTALDSMPVEPNGLTPLDNTIVFAGACHANSGSHDTHNLPLLVAGGKRYKMAQGQHIAFPMVSDVGNLYFTMAKAMGVAGASFNGHNTELNGLFAAT